MHISATGALNPCEIPVTDTRSDIEVALERDYERIRGLASRFGLRGEDRDDAAQEIMALAWAARTRFRGDSAASTWLTRIAVNYLTSNRRKLVGRLRAWLIHQPEATGRLRATDRIAEANEVRDRVRGAIQELPTAMRRVFVLRYLEEMSVDEVAQILGIPPGTVRSRGYHARIRLRESLQEYAG